MLSCLRSHSKVILHFPWISVAKDFFCIYYMFYTSFLKQGKKLSRKARIVSSISESSFTNVLQENDLVSLAVTIESDIFTWTSQWEFLVRRLHIATFKSFSEPSSFSTSSPLCKLGLNFMLLALHCDKPHFLRVPGTATATPYRVSSYGLQIPSALCIYFHIINSNVEKYQD